MDYSSNGRPGYQAHEESSPMAYSCSAVSRTPEYKFRIGITQLSAKTPVDDAGDGRPGHQVHRGSSPMAYSHSSTLKTSDLRFWIGLE